MSLYQNILKQNPSIGGQFKRVLPWDFKPIVYNNYNKECSKNNKIYRRTRPVDGRNKNNILPPRPRVRESTNPKKYDRHDDVYPLSSEKLLENIYSFNKHHDLQKMGYINDEAFLLNINKKTDKHKIFNIHNNIVKMDDESEVELQFKDNEVHNNVFNERTNRKMIIKDITNTDQKWCSGAVVNMDDFKETNEPIAYNA
jgi:hypothetical protein